MISLFSGSPTFHRVRIALGRLLQRLTLLLKSIPNTNTIRNCPSKNNTTAQGKGNVRLVFGLLIRELTVDRPLYLASLLQELMNVTTYVMSGPVHTEIA